MWLYFNIGLGYNIFLDDYSTLTLSLENEFDEIMLSPRFDNSNNMLGIFTPAIAFNRELDFGDLFFQLGLPITYIQHDKDDDIELSVFFTAGWTSNFGLYLDITAEIPFETEEGLSIIPYLSYAFSNGFEVFAFCRFDAIGADSGDIRISPALGLTFSF